MSIFLRTFLSFWITTVMIAVIGMGMVWITHPPMPIQPLSLHLPQLSACVASALRAPDSGETKQIAGQCGVIYIQDSAGRERLGAQADAEVHALAGRVTAEVPLGLRPMPNKLMVAFAVPIDTMRFIAVAILPDQTSMLPPMLWWQLLAATLVSTMSCLLLTRHLVNPIRELQLCTEAFGRGKLDSRPDDRLLRRKDELGELSLTIGQMSDRISRLMGSQKDFLIQVSHELGSPLTRLNVALALARRKAPESLRPEFDRIQYESTELNSMVQQLLRLARFESGLERQGQELFSLHQLMLEVCHDNELVANESHKQLQLVYSVQVYFWGYRELLKRAVDNVLRNAIRFTPEGSRVELVAEIDPAGQMVLIQVRDSGPGVQEDKLDSIFEPFVRGSSDRTGAGLGLAIAKRAVMANRGTIRAINLSEGGLLVEIKLPCAPGEGVNREEAAEMDFRFSQASSTSGLLLKEKGNAPRSV